MNLLLKAGLVKLTTKQVLKWAEKKDIGKLEYALVHGIYDVRKFAADSLGKLKSWKSLSLLTESIDDNIKEVSFAAMKAVELIELTPELEQKIRNKKEYWNNKDSNESNSNTPVFDQWKEDTLKKQKDFDKYWELIIPIIKHGTVSNKIMINGVEEELPESSLPVISPLPFGNLSIILGINYEHHVEWLQNKHIEIVQGIIPIDGLIKKAYHNFTSIITGSMKIEMLNESTGMIVGCYGFESSLIMVDIVWDKLKDILKSSELIFGIPTQDVFIFCKSGNQEAISILKSKIHEVYSNPEYPKKISPDTFINNKEGTIKIYNENIA